MLHDILEDVRRRLEQIREAAERGDSETAHDLEDKLLWHFVQLAADGDPYAPERLDLIATEVLKSREIDFKRWCG